LGYVRFPAREKGDKDVKKGFKKTTPVALDFIEKNSVIRRGEFSNRAKKVNSHKAAGDNYYQTRTIRLNPLLSCVNGGISC
jgi:hypothetical protein